METLRVGPQVVTAVLVVAMLVFSDWAALDAAFAAALVVPLRRTQVGAGAVLEDRTERDEHLGAAHHGSSEGGLDD